MSVAVASDQRRQWEREGVSEGCGGGEEWGLWNGGVYFAGALQGEAK